MLCFFLPPIVKTNRSGFVSALIRASDWFLVNNNGCWDSMSIKYHLLYQYDEKKNKRRFLIDAAEHKGFHPNEFFRREFKVGAT